MNNYDFTPLYRNSVGFDRLLSMLTESQRSDNQQNGYPPFNIEMSDENNYQITMAVAGFEPEELDIEVEGENLKIIGKKSKTEDKHHFLHRGIATRSFERSFRLADHIKVKDARLHNGLMHLDLIREIPEALKPRKISIKTNNSTTLIDKSPKAA